MSNRPQGFTVLLVLTIGSALHSAQAARSSTAVGISLARARDHPQRSLCHWQHDECVPTYTQLFAPGAPTMRTFNARAYASALALEQQCASSAPQGQGGCPAPCHWSQQLGCHMGHMDALRHTLACSGSEVRE